MGNEAKREWSSPAVAAVAKFAIERMRSYEGSHDWRHALRVHALAVQIASELREKVDLELVELSALVHDVYDRKVWKPDRAAGEPETSAEMLALALRRDAGLEDENRIAKIVNIADGISYSKQTKRPMPKHERTIEMDIVQDADRLESLGAIGIARVFACGGAMHSTMEDSREHFDSKLVKLLPLMQTEPGRKRAVKRDAFLREFIKMYDEDIGVASSSLDYVQ